jgi:hypothetical protein
LWTPFTMSPLRAGRPSTAASSSPGRGDVIDVPALLLELESRFERARLSAGEYDLWLELAGRALLLRFAGPAMRDALAPAFRHLVIDEPGGGAAMQIDVWDGESAGVEPPEIPWSAADLDKLGVLPSAGDGRLGVVCDVAYGAITVIDAGRHRALFQVPSAAAVPWYERAAPLRVALNQLLSASGATLVHAGAVGDAGRGALLVGQGGSGKSTLAVASALDGMYFGGDDYVAVTLEQDPVAHSVHITAKLSERSLELLPGLAITPRELLPDEKHVVEMDLQERPRIRRRVPLTAVVAPRITDGEPSWKRIRGAEGLRAMAPSTMLQLPATGRSGLSIMASLARAIPSYSLELGGDPARSVGALGEILDDAR